MTEKGTRKPPQEAQDLNSMALAEAMAPRPRPRLLRAPGPSETPSWGTDAGEAEAGEPVTTH